MKTALAWRKLVHGRLRSLAAVAAVALPVTMVFVQLGFSSALAQSATLFYDHMVFDLAILSKDYLVFGKTGELSLARLQQARGVADVSRVVPLRLGFALWRDPVGRGEREILVLGVDPRRLPFTDPVLAAAGSELSLPDRVYFDARSRPEYGPRELGMRSELGGRRVQVAGIYHQGTGFTALGAAVVGEQTFAATFPGRGSGRVNVGLVEVVPGAAPEAVAAVLRRVLPADVQVWTRERLADNEGAYWSQATSVGVILAFGLVVAAVVGVIILHQVLATDIEKSLPEYATLKAMGYHQRQVSAVVLQQALIIALAAFGPALAMSLGIYRVTEAATNLPMGMSPGRVLLVLGATVAVCGGSGLASLRKLRRADPAELV
jgi:putative ABC transport system permease protein